MIEIKLWEIKRRTLCRAERNSVYCNIIIILPHGLANGSASDLCQAKNNKEQHNIVITLTVGDREGFYKSNKGINSSLFATGLTSLPTSCLLLIQFCTLYPKFIAPGIVL